MKKKRQDTILSLIAAEEIPTQEVLRERMEEHGFAVTQATLSRDIRELKLTKERRGSGRACYTAPVRQEVNGGIHREDVVGTIAGDDTIFVLLRTEIQAKEFAGSFAKLMETGGF